MKKSENYTSLVITGLVITVLILAGVTLYWLRETPRLATASESYTSERVDHGKAIYDKQCVACHGSNGEGGVGPALNNKTLLKNTLDNVFFSLIRSGVPNTQMPAWSVDYGGPLTDEDVRNVVAYLRSWEPTAPEITPQVFTPDAGRGALLFSSTCAICHGENGVGTDKAPKLNDLTRLNALDDNWYRETVRNGRPAKGMPTWGTVLSPNQIEDLIALIDTWRKGIEVQPAFDVTQLLDSAVFSLENNDPGSAELQVKRALNLTTGPAAEVLRNAEVQLQNNDQAGAINTLKALKDQWPIGDPTNGQAIFAQYCSPCHGANGEGGIGKTLKPNEFIQSQNNSQLIDFIKKGRSGTAMAGFSGRLNDAQLADVVSFLRSWQK